MTIAEARPISDRKRAANQANAQKSTGPRTAEGKKKVSLNAVTHGLRSEMIVVQGEDPALFEAMRLGFFNDWRPPTETRRALVDRLAADTWRLRRCVKIEQERINEQIDKALNAHDEAIKARMREGFRLLTAQPGRGLQFFKGEYTGVRILIEAWEALGTILGDPARWNDPRYHIRLLNLLGHRGDADALDVEHPAAMVSWQLYAWNCPDDGQCEEPIRDAAEAKEGADALAGFAADQADDLRKSLDRYPHPDFVRQRIAERASCDTSNEGRALQRYEGQLARSFRANLNQVMTLTKTGIDLIEEEDASAEAPNKPTEAPADAPIKATEAVAAPNKATEPPLESPNKATDRPSDDCQATADDSSEAVADPLFMQNH